MTLTGTCVGLFIMSCNFTGGDSTAVVCPPVRTWSKSFQAQVAQELRAAPNSAMGKVVIDTIGDRDAARACARKR
jgi:hypothetical protein